MNPIAIVRQTNTVSLTFTNKPSEEDRKALKNAGYRYENGNWFRSHSESQLATQEVVAQVLAVG